MMIFILTSYPLKNSKKNIDDMGLRQQFKIRKYDWDVVIYYTVDEK